MTKLASYMENDAPLSEYWEFIHNRKEKSTLKPVQNFRQTTPRVCATCSAGIHKDGRFVCSRPDGIETFTQSGDQWEYTCDRYAKK
jgi:hypothetical protein